MFLNTAERKKIQGQVLETTVRIRTGETIGSGTVIKSTPWNMVSKTGGTWVLTNRHVVAPCIEYDDVWSELLQRKVKKEFLSQCEVDRHRLDELGCVAGLSVANACIELSNEVQDMALLRIKDTETYPTAILYPEKEAVNIPMLVSLLCCGAALGERPIVTAGLLNGQQIEIKNYEYYMSGAPSIFGNSGGSIFTPWCEEGEYDSLKDIIWAYMGIPSRVAVEVSFFGVDAITHMGYFIPMKRIYEWLDEQCYRFLWDDSTTEKKCDEEREQKRQEELSLHTSRERN